MLDATVLRTAACWLAAALGALGAARLAAADEAPTVKWHPGHYMLVYLGENADQRAKHFDDIAKEEAVLGAQVRYRWADLEPRKGQYDFSAIEKDLQRLQSRGKRLVIQVLNRAYNADSPEGVVPDYLTSDPAYGGGVAPTRNGFVPRIWEAPVMDRQIALYRALGDRFDREPYVEAVVGGETTLSFGKNRPEGFSNGRLAREIGRWIDATYDAWPRTNLYVYTNFLSGNLEEIVAKCASGKCGVGGPDVLPPPHSGTEGDRILMGKSGGVDYRGRMPVAYAVQTPELGGSKGTFTPEQLFTQAYSELRANYIFWIRNEGSGGAAQKWDTGILPFIRSIRGKINEECPPTLEGRCGG